jgi:hypothetical protein
VTDGGQDFVRVYSQPVYGVPLEQVVGTAGATKFSYDKDGKAFLTTEPRLLLNDDKAGKPEGIHLMIGRRPRAAFGNSDGDRQMLEYTAAGNGARLMMLVLHDDAEREYAYGPAQGLPATMVGSFTQSLHDEATKAGWPVISMKRDWKRIFAFDNPRNLGWRPTTVVAAAVMTQSGNRVTAAPGRNALFRLQVEVQGDGRGLADVRRVGERVDLSKNRRRNRRRGMIGELKVHDIGGAEAGREAVNRAEMILNTRAYRGIGLPISLRRGGVTTSGLIDREVELFIFDIGAPESLKRQIRNRHAEVLRRHRHAAIKRHGYVFARTGIPARRDTGNIRCSRRGPVDGSEHAGAGEKGHPISGGDGRAQRYSPAGMEIWLVQSLHRWIAVGRVARDGDRYKTPG